MDQRAELLTRVHQENQIKSHVGFFKHRNTIV